MLEIHIPSYNRPNSQAFTLVMLKELGPAISRVVVVVQDDQYQSYKSYFSIPRGWEYITYTRQEVEDFHNQEWGHLPEVDLVTVDFARNRLVENAKSTLLMLDDNISSYILRAKRSFRIDLLDLMYCIKPMYEWYLSSYSKGVFGLGYTSAFDVFKAMPYSFQIMNPTTFKYSTYWGHEDILHAYTCDRNGYPNLAFRLLMYYKKSTAKKGIGGMRDHYRKYDWDKRNSDTLLCIPEEDKQYFKINPMDCVDTKGRDQLSYYNTYTPVPPPEVLEETMDLLIKRLQLSRSFLLDINKEKFGRCIRGDKYYSEGCNLCTIDEMLDVYRTTHYDRYREKMFKYLKNLRPSYSLSDTQIELSKL